MADDQQLTSDQFAAQIKAKYPQYKDVPNGELTQKIVAKYPQYKSKVKMEEHMPGNTGGAGGSWEPGPKQDYLTRAEDFVGGITTSMAKGAAETVNAVTGLANKALPSGAQIPSIKLDDSKVEKSAYSKEYYEKGKTVGTAAEMAEEYSVGEGALKALTTAVKLKDATTVTRLITKYPKLKIALEGMKAATIGTAQSAAHGEAHPFAEGAVTGLAGAGGEMAAQVLTKMGPAAISKSASLMNRYLGLMKSDMPKWDRFKVGSAEEIGKTVIDNVGVKGTLPEQHAAIEAKRALVNTANEHMLSQVTARAVPLHANLNDIEMKVGQKLLDIGKLSDQAAAGLKNVVKQLKDSYNPNMTVQEALALRRKIGAHIDWGSLKLSDNPQQLVWGELYHSLNDSIENALPSSMARKFAANNKLQERLMIARDAAAEKINAQAKATGPGAVSKAGKVIVGAGLGAGLGAAAGSRFGETGEGAVWGAIGGAGIGHGAPAFDWARADIKASMGREAVSKGLKKVAPRLAALAKKSPVVGRAVEAITAAHGGGSGALASQP